jgi:uncharacterized protein (TIGR02449 family)
MATQSPLERELEILTEKIERLAILCTKLRAENQQLKAQIAHLTEERNQYLTQTLSARAQVKRMLERMQALTR